MRKTIVIHRPVPVLTKYYALLMLFLCSALGAEAQGLLGKITDNDSSATVLFQAEVTQYQDGKLVGTYKTFYDGTYRIKVKPSQTYEIKATYPGRSDTTVTITTDKFGTLATGTLHISLRKNGLRLMGYIMDREDDIPIKDVGIIIRNVMTRKEDRYFTDVNGYYNVKMDFETNYTFKIDKRSPGIMNKFQDTSFNISTIGFNQPLDFRLDIRLGPSTEFVKARPEYDPYARPENKNLKPVVQVMGKKDSARLREQTAALEELDRKLGSKDSAIASIDKKLKAIDAVKQDEKQALNTDKEQKAKEAAERQRIETERKVQAEQKKREAEKAEADLKARQAADAEAKKKEREAAEARRKEELRAAAELKARQEADEARARQEAKEKEDAANRSKAEQQRIAREEQALARADSALAAAEARRIQSGKPRPEARREDKKPEVRKPLTQEEKEAQALARADSAIAAAREKKAKKEEPTVARTDQAPANDKKSGQKEAAAGKITYAVVPSDSAMTDRERREQKEQDLAKMKKARSDAEAKILAERRENEAKEKAAKKESKRLARELAEKEKQDKRHREDDLRHAEDAARMAAKKSEAERQQRELEARRAQEEEERRKLVSQRDKLLSNQQVAVVKNTEPKDNSPVVSKTAPVRDQARIDTARVVVLNSNAQAAGRTVVTRGQVKNGQTEEPVAGVSINIRRLNGLVSQEVTTDSLGAYTFVVDSGYFYLVSYFREGYEISKQILDLTSYRRPQYTMLIQYLKEHDEFDPAARMPFIQFVKNSSKVPSDLWGELEPIVKMMQDIPQLKMKIYGMASADEDYPMELSVTRARMVADVMMEAGIKPLRLRINGLGDLRPRSGCVEGKECTQDQYRQDRMVMYKVVKE